MESKYIQSIMNIDDRWSFNYLNILRNLQSQNSISFKGKGCWYKIFNHFFSLKVLRFFPCPMRLTQSSIKTNKKTYYHRLLFALSTEESAFSKTFKSVFLTTVFLKLVSILGKLTIKISTSSISYGEWS